MSKELGDVTELLQRAQRGEPTAAERLFVLLQHELRALAQTQMASERRGHTLQATALVNEAWLRIAAGGAAYANRGQFLSAAARAMRHVLVDHARARKAAKRDGALQRVPLDETLAKFEEQHLDMLAIDEALERLGARDPEAARVVELRFFAGLTSDSAAEVIGITSSQAEEAWAMGRAFLSRILGDARA